MDSTEQVAAIERDLEKARYAIEKVGVKAGGSGENVYSALYQQLVRLGARPQLRLKYRNA